MIKKSILIYIVISIVLTLNTYVDSGPLLDNEQYKEQEVLTPTPIKTPIETKPIANNFTIQDETISESTDLQQKDIKEVSQSEKNEQLIEKPEIQSKETSTVTTKNHIIAIDAGHQLKGNNDKEPIGPNALESKPKVSAGTTGISSGLPEYELNLQIALKLEQALINEGYEVYMVRTTNDVNLSNAERAELANNSGAEIFIRIHGNGSEDSSVKGITTLCPSQNNEYCSFIAEDSYKLSSNLLDALVLETNDKSLGVSEADNMTGINWCKIPVSIVEVGFMTNPETDTLLNTDEYQNKIVKGMILGINKYFE